jgi:hypothetical protein
MVSGWEVSGEEIEPVLVGNKPVEVSSKEDEEVFL